MKFGEKVDYGGRIIELILKIYSEYRGCGRFINLSTIYTDSRDVIGFPLPPLFSVLARDVIYMLRCQCPSVCSSVRLSVTEVLCGHGACREEGRVISRYASHC